MSIALSEFWSRLVRVGITDSDGCRELAASYSRAHQNTPPSTAKSLAKFLVTKSVLTKFQARSLLAAELGTLRVGPWLIVQDHGPSPFTTWLSVKHVEDGRHGVLLRASQEALAGGRDLWLDAHKQVFASTLQSFDLEQTEVYTTIFSSLPQGCSLVEFLRRNEAMSALQVVDLGIAIADALQALHSRPLFHGRTRLDRVWFTEQGTAILLRDPTEPPATPWEETGGGWLDATDPPAAYIAPEFIDPSQSCDVGTDIYSLGCLLFRLLTGRPAVAANSVEAALEQHASETVPELAEAVAKGESGDPLFRVLAYAMAKTSAARFGTADQLAAALKAVRPMVEATPKVDAVSPTGIATDSQSFAASKGKLDPKLVEETPKRENRSNKQQTTESTNAKATKRAGKSEETKSTQSGESRRAAKAVKKTKPIHPPSAENAQGKHSRTKDRSSKRSQNSAKENFSESPKKNPTISSPEVLVGETADESSSSRKLSPKEKTPSVLDVVRETPGVPPQTAPNLEASTPVTAPPATTEINIAVPPRDGATTTPQVELNRESQTGPQDATKKETEPLRRRRKKKDRRAPIVLGGLCVAVLILLIGLMVPPSEKPQPEPRRRPPAPEIIPPVTNRPTNDPATESTSQAVVGYQLVSDDRLLYVPPYAADSETPSLELLPPGPAVILSWNVASVIDAQYSQDLLSALSPDLDDLMQKVTSITRISLDEVKRCTIALHPGSAGWPEASLCVELAAERPRDELIELWQVAASRTSSGATIYAGDSVDSSAFYLPETENSGVTRFAVGSIQRMSEVAEAEGGAIPLARSTERLWSGASSNADLVALITPNFLFADGREMLSSAVPELVGPLKSVLIPDVAGALLTVEIDDEQCYLETRLAPSGGTSQAALLRKLQTTIDAWPQWAEDFIVTSVPDASWRLLASRMPSMMRFVADRFRYGISDGVIIANTYLPMKSIPQLSVAVVFAMNTSGQSLDVMQADPAIELSVEEMLGRKMSVSFDQESLEFAIDAIVGAFKAELPKGVVMPPVRIIGADLELSGITQNQQVRDFAKSEVSLRSVLTDLVVGANPDKSSTGPSDPKQALIWVSVKNSAGKPEILITTRKVAAGKYELPKEFQTADAN